MPEHLVEFYPYCRVCENAGKAETEHPCCECLENPVNQDSHRPLYFKKSRKSSRRKHLSN